MPYPHLLGRLVCLVIVVLASIAKAGEVEHINLGGDWNLSQDDSPAYIPARVPGCVHLDLLTAGKIPDPFYRDNQKAVQWISDSSWSYTRDIQLPPEFLRHEHIVLRCEGLDTVAEISINQQLVAMTDNMFRTYEFDCKGLLKPGSNLIKVVFRPIGPYISTFVSNASGHLSSVKGMANLRKAPYSNGWDFGPKLLTAGIYKKIELIGFDQGRLVHPAVSSHFQPDGRVSIWIDADVERGSPPLTLNAEMSFQTNLISTEAKLVTGNQIHLELPVSDPHLWWPAGMGSQPLYDLKLSLKSAEGEMIDQQSLRIGIRHIELLPKTDSKPLRLSVNGREIFAKGVDWIPLDMFPPRVSAEKLHRYIADAAAANMNMIRCWGGGYYEEDSFYDACDEYGILVWSEFKFACAVYPSGNAAFIDNVRAEVTDQVNRLRNHSCIAVWSGNNEVTSLITGYKILSRADYDVLFHNVMGGQIHGLIPDANYVGGSPEAGDEHNWWVWHVGADFEKYFDSHGWMTEFGFQSFPCPATVESYTVQDDRTSVLTPVMKAHQHNGNGRGNEMIVEMMSRYFRPAKDFDSTLWLSQINQAYGVTMGIEHWRADWPASSGSLVWQYDDCWPGASWSSVDYFGRFKALQYKLREAFAPLMVVARYKPALSNVEIHVCSDLPAACEAKVIWRLTDTAGTVVGDGNHSVAVPAGTCSVVCPPIAVGEAIKVTGPANALLWINLESAGKTVSSKTVWFVRPKEISLREPGITAQVAAASEGFDVTLSTVRPALWAWLDIDGDPDARYSDNFIHLPPGRSISVHIISSMKVSAEVLINHLKVRSLFDTSVAK